jgi:hypothetical protein
VLATLLNSATATGRGAAFDVRNANKALFVVTGTFDGKVAFEGSVDGTDWFFLPGRVNNEKETSTFTRRPCIVQFDVEPVAYIAPNVQEISSGSVTVVGYAEGRRIGGYAYAHFNAATSGTLVKSGEGVLHSVSIGDAGSGMTVSVYDGVNTSGTLLGVYKVAGSFILDAEFTAGLYVAISGTTVGDVTLCYL